MFTILFGIHFAIRAVIDWVWGEDLPGCELIDDPGVDLDLYHYLSDLYDTTDGGGTGTRDGGGVGASYRSGDGTAYANVVTTSDKGGARIHDGDGVYSDGDRVYSNVVKRFSRERNTSQHVDGVGTRKRESSDKSDSISDDLVVPVKVAHLTVEKRFNKHKKGELSSQHVVDTSSRKRELSDRNNSGNDEVDVPVKVAHLSTAVTEQESQEPFDVRKVHGYEEMPFLSDDDTVNFIKHSHTMFIMRGLPGSGKSTLVKCLQEIYKGSVTVCSADDFFYGRDGTYNFDAGKLSEAHKFCQNKAAYHCDKGTRVVIIDNTNIQRWAMGFYMKLAQSRCYYHVIIVEPQTPWKYNPDELARRNKHKVDREIIAKKLQSLRDNVYRPLYYGWFLSKDDSSMLVKKSREVLKQCINEVAWPDLSSPCDDSESFTALEDILNNVVISYTDPVPMLHCTAAYLARRSRDAYHTDAHVVRALGRTFTLKISGFVYSKQALSARVILQENESDSVSAESGSGSRDVLVNSAVSSNASCSNKNSETSSLISLYVKGEEEILCERFRDVHLHAPDSDEKHALFQNGCSAHITIGYANDGQSKFSGENILKILELEFYGKVKQKKSSVGIVSAYGQDLFQIQLNEPLEVSCLFQGFYSGRG